MPGFANILMKSCAAVAAAALLASCGEQKQVAVEPLPVVGITQQNREIAERLQAQMVANEIKATQEGEAAERQHLINLLSAPIARWVDMFQQLPDKPLAEVNALATKMQDIQAEMGAVPTSPCTEPKRSEVISGMEAVSALLAEYKTAKAEAVADISKRLGEAFVIVERGAGALSACA